MAFPSNTRLFTFDNADLQVLVTYEGQRVVGRVSSDAICRASKVWEKFIHPPFGVVGTGRLVAKDDTPKLGCTSENMNSASPRNPPTSPQPSAFPNPKGMIPELDMKEWAGPALLIIFRIAHLEFSNIPKKVSSQELHEIARIIDYADCVELVEPWFEGWFAGVSSHEIHMFFPFWVFGKEQQFEKLAAKSLLGKEFSQLRALDANKQQKMIGKICEMPPGLAESIHIFRVRVIRILLDIPYTEANAYTDINKLGKRRCCHNDSHCDSTSYGSLILQLVELELWPPREPETIKRSISSLAHSLTSMKTLHLSAGPYPAFSADNIHQSCPKMNIREKVEEVMKRLPSPVLGSHKAHMATQYRRLHPGTLEKGKPQLGSRGLNTGRDFLPSKKSLSLQAMRQKLNNTV
ncbi:hypothetical protein HYFRA_00004652 [Hymenoscyphus fraxineus]|uniref:Uncharacterized protein n=1 Tax=Hymenoscyphus fraxineus TaxID=746836 RepID=A0A9N9KWG6_9HELO|nr:hypothetical protein HYFRA_00004652 [Hymenoscyphus fraxineus]